MGKYLLYFSWCIMLLAGCSISPQDFVKKIENTENGLRVEKQTAKYKYTLQYCPYDYMYILENKATNLTEEGFNKKKENLEGLIYFILSVDKLSADEKKLDRNSNEFGSVYDYFSSYFEYFVQLDCGGQTLPCSLFHTEGLYGIESGIKIHMGFENTCGSNNLTLKFLNELDSQEPIEISIQGENIKNKPEFKF